MEGYLVVPRETSIYNALPYSSFQASLYSKLMAFLHSSCFAFVVLTSTLLHSPQVYGKETKIRHVVSVHSLLPSSACSSPKGLITFSITSLVMIFCLILLSLSETNFIEKKKKKKSLCEKKWSKKISMYLVAALLVIFENWFFFFFPKNFKFPWIFHFTTTFSQKVKRNQRAAF